jgi:hypothetical protein
MLDNGSDDNLITRAMADIYHLDIQSTETITINQVTGSFTCSEKAVAEWLDERQNINNTEFIVV